MNEQKLLSQEYSMESYGMLDAGDFLPPPLLPEAKWFPQENHLESLTHNPSIWKAQKLVPKNIQNDQVTRAEEERGECIVSDLNFQNLVWHRAQIYPTSPMNVVEGGQQWVILNDFDEEIYLLGAGSPTAKGCVRFTERSRVCWRWIREQRSVISSPKVSPRTQKCSRRERFSFGASSHRGRLWRVTHNPSNKPLSFSSSSCPSFSLTLKVPERAEWMEKDKDACPPPHAGFWASEEDKL